MDHLGRWTSRKLNLYIRSILSGHSLFSSNIYFILVNRCGYHHLSVLTLSYTSLRAISDGPSGYVIKVLRVTVFQNS